MNLSLSQWLFYSLELLCILLIVVGLFGRQILLKAKWGGSHVKSTSLRPWSHWHSPSWVWLSEWTIRWKGYAETYWVLSVCLFAVLGFASVPLKHYLEPAETMTGHYWFLPHVPEAMADNIYVVLLLDRDDPLYGSRPRYTFCAKGKPVVFNEGELITDIVYKEHGDCKEILHYNLERDEHYRTKHYPENEYPKEAFNGNRR